MHKYKNPEEEYFRLTLLALKMKFAEKDPYFGGFNLSGDLLYEKYNENPVPFHKLYDWIRDELMIYVSDKRLVR